MANTAAGRRGSGGQLTIVWMALAIVLVAGFLFWLAAASEPSNMVAIQEGRDDAAPTMTDAPTRVAIDEFAAAPADYQNRNIELQNVTVASPIGQHAFWIDVGRGQPFLVRMTPEVVAEGRALRGGEVVTISGPVLARTDSVIAAWEQQGVITSEGQRMEVEFATTFLEARRVVAGQSGAR
jgi:hypothetical protein